MKPQDDATGYVYSDIPWRYSGLSARVFGLDPAVVLLLPLAILGLRQGWGTAYQVVLGLIFLLFIYVAVKGYASMRVFLHGLSILLVGRARWKTR